MALLKNHVDADSMIVMTEEEHDHLTPPRKKIADTLINEGRARIVDAEA